MSEPYSMYKYGASQSHSSCCELISHRRATDEVVPAAQPLSAPHFLDRSALLRCKFKFLRSVSEFSRIDYHFQSFQRGLQHGYLSLNPPC